MNHITHAMIWFFGGTLLALLCGYLKQGELATYVFAISTLAAVICGYYRINKETPR